jgi:hypothetical protein
MSIEFGTLSAILIVGVSSSLAILLFTVRIYVKDSREKFQIIESILESMRRQQLRTDVILRQCVEAMEKDESPTPDNRQSDLPEPRIRKIRFSEEVKE